MKLLTFLGVLIPLLATAVHAAAPRESNMVSSGGVYSMESDVAVSGMGDAIQSAGAIEIMPERDATTANASQSDWVLYE